MSSLVFFHSVIFKFPLIFELIENLAKQNKLEIAFDIKRYRLQYIIIICAQMNKQYHLIFSNICHKRQ